MTPKELLARFEPKEPATKPPTVTAQLGTIRYSKCGRFLIGGGFDGRVHRWDVSGPTPRELPPLVGHGGWVQTLAVHPGGRGVVTGDSWGSCKVWDIADPAAKPKSPRFVLAAYPRVRVPRTTSPS